MSDGDREVPRGQPGRPGALGPEGSRGAAAPSGGRGEARRALPVLELAGRAVRLAGCVVANRRRAVPRPSLVTYLVTNRCNARCGMCDSWRMKRGDELSVEGAEAIFRRVGRLDAVRLTGGEPFLREDLTALARAVVEASRPLLLHVTTNGSFPERVEAFAAELSPGVRVHVMVSVDGEPEEHDQSRGARVTFALVEETLRRLVARGVSATVNHTVISPESMDAAPRLRERFRRMGVQVQSVLAYEGSSMYGLGLRGKKATHLVVPQGYPLHPALRGADVAGHLRRELVAAEELTDPWLRLAKRYYLRGLAARLVPGVGPAHGPPCTALRSHLRLLPDGRVPVCQFNTESVGDLRALPFDELWRSAAAAEARAWVDACPGCWAECEVLPSAVYSGDLFSAVLPGRVGRPAPAP